MTADRYRPLTAAAVLLVATIAAVVSYMHVATLALRYGQPPLAAYLLPLSIDGLVASSSLVLLRAARAQVSAPWLARTGLVLAVVATLAANVASGAAHGWPGALLAGWPAVAFVISAETAISMSRRRVASGHPPGTRPATAGGQPASSGGHRGGHPGHPGHPAGHDQRRSGRGGRGVHPDSPPLPVTARTRGQRPPNRISARGGVLA
jgi:hypothetical protein